ncbi:DUF6173 family protein [Pseudooceanicola sp.]|uniref:DUF6173 family protein n=1 Tax=Pseudooceanicola sp. TaxID=1914328 RepID=UPI0026132166|nr:DUF6173 family protein [Pseudooceanicola sp.]MDF1855333.1 DUF6173 family protein [Pseudooceanicola sp.]
MNCDTISTAAEATEADAIPRRHDVHADEAASSDQPCQLNATKPVEAKSPAEWAYERLIIYIQNFEQLLDSEHEVAIGFAGSDAGVMRIEGMGFFDPDIVTFYGTDADEARVQLVQHVSQLNVMLRALPKQVNSMAPQRIGFRLAADLERQGQTLNENPE